MPHRSSSSPSPRSGSAGARAGGGGAEEPRRSPTRERQERRLAEAPHWARRPRRGSAPQPAGSRPLRTRQGRAGARETRRRRGSGQTLGAWAGTSTPRLVHRRRESIKRPCGGALVLAGASDDRGQGETACYQPGHPMPRVLSVDRSHPDERALAEAARVLRGGGLVAFPTETVYGLGALALDEAGARANFRGQGPPGAPSAHRARRRRSAGSSARRVMAGSGVTPCRCVLARAADARRRPRGARAGGGGGRQVVDGRAGPGSSRGPRAHRGGRRARRRAERQPVPGHLADPASHVTKQLGDAVDLVLDAGPTDAGIESTVVDVRDSPPAVLRPGALDLARLRAGRGHRRPRAARVARRTAQRMPPVAGHGRAALRAAGPHAPRPDA